MEMTDMASYRIMSCNVRTQTPVDEEQQFFNRVDFLCETLIKLAPDVIGFQEVTHIMRKELILRLPGYGLLGASRGKDRLGEASIIAYRLDKFMPERLISDLLSYEPHKPGSRFGGDQSSCPRIFSSVDLMPIEGGQPFRVMNIHTDHIGVNARFLEVEQMLRSFADQQVTRPMPTVITGDFNALPDAPEIKLMSSYPDLRDITAHLPGTFHDFGRCEPYKIDYIFATPRWREIQVIALRDKKEHLFLSDHDLILADLELEA
ncbi:MAG: hypothetical protein E7646_08765 [Ruminococcaceae bacterium]|nr:hypothetical protein [Oscillospiraceae bacterium]